MAKQKKVHLVSFTVTDRSIDPLSKAELRDIIKQQLTPALIEATLGKLSVTEETDG